MKKAIILAIDQNYLERALVTIKSICAHNQNIRFYLFNQDTPIEWTKIVNHQLSALNCELINVKILNHDIERFQTFLTTSIWLPFFAEDYVEEDIALYLDADTIVTDSIDHLFTIDFQDNYLAAVQDPNVDDFGNFNSGVMLINLKKWKQEKIKNKLLAIAAENHDKVRNGDQSILNLAFKGKWLPLHKYYNYQLYDSVSRYPRYRYLYEDLGDTIPTIIHFLSFDKPWLEFSQSRFRDLWWHYFAIEFADLKRLHQIISRNLMTLLSTKRCHALILTNSEDLENINHIIDSLPNIQFHIGAYTTMSDKLLALQIKENVILYPQIIDPKIEKLLNTCQVYLDINHGDEIADILNKAKEKELDIFAFDITSHDPSKATKIFTTEQTDELIKSVQVIEQKLITTY